MAQKNQRKHTPIILALFNGASESWEEWRKVVVGEEARNSYDYDAAGLVKAWSLMVGIQSL